MLGLPAFTVAAQPTSRSLPSGKVGSVIKTLDGFAGYGLYNYSHTIPAAAVTAEFVVPKYSCTGKTPNTTSFYGVSMAASSEQGTVGFLAVVVESCDTAWPTLEGYWYSATTGTYGFEYINPSPGDTINTTIVYNGATFYLSWDDITSGASATNMTSAAGYSVTLLECGTTMENVLPPWGSLLPSYNFGTIPFSNCKARIEGGAWAGIGSWGIYSVELVCYGTTGHFTGKVLARPSKLVKYENFNVVYVRKGP